jgi:hypothetical protein
MIFTALVVASVIAPQTLSRVFTKGESKEYEVTAALVAETRSIGLDTFIPQDITIRYKFNTLVENLKADGIADVRYKRPAIVQVDGETMESPTVTKTERLNQNLLLTVSPINEILSVKDETPKPPGKPGSKTDSSQLLLLAKRAAASNWQDGGIVGRFIGELYRLSLFVGALDTSLDFNPKLPFDAVEKGATWKRTVSHQPQSLQSKGKQAVQRLDLTYSYEGIVPVNNVNVQRVQAKLTLKTDLATFINQLLKEEGINESGLNAIPMELEQVIDFDLDPKTFHTIRATAVSKGGFKIVISRFPNDPIREEQFKGKTVLRLLPQQKRS